MECNVWLLVVADITTTGPIQSQVWPWHSVGERQVTHFRYGGLIHEFSVHEKTGRFNSNYYHFNGLLLFTVIKYFSTVPKITWKIGRYHFKVFLIAKFCLFHKNLIDNPQDLRLTHNMRLIGDHRQLRTGTNKNKQLFDRAGILRYLALFESAL